MRVAVEDSAVLVHYTIRKFYIQHIRSIEWLVLCNACHSNTLYSSRSNPAMPARCHVWSRRSISPAGPSLPSACSSSPRKSKAPNPPFASIVVHCSASVGQTGRFIVIVGMMDKMHAGQEVDVFGFVWKSESSVCSSSRRTCIICSSTRRQNAPGLFSGDDSAVAQSALVRMDGLWS
ncbi:receptor-type tyrosine-protein phosphatase alpha-like [Hippocampus comes]|uniref:receptor-type tyrosine-protein phosphatase alpha-like n=1 Tax=Hippocampus comes TaxID=109280 RepID=UPI00094F0BBC|nr:PREDICTED: receptor-type tyrosine-protein phosphatase alpha-like [Hippocampus comes]